MNKEKNLISLSSTAKLYLLSSSLFYWGPQLDGLLNSIEHTQIRKAITHEENQLLFKDVSFTNMWASGVITKEAAVTFTQQMHSTIFAPAIGAINSGLFAETKNLLDMGGGSGCFSIAFVDKYKHVKSTVFDLPEVCDVAAEYIRKFKYSKSISVQPGNFFKPLWPNGHDGILFSQVFHDWQPEQCLYLAKQAHAHLPIGGKIFIHEMLLKTNTKSSLSIACFNLLMFVNHQSQQFTKKEIFALLKKAGFKYPSESKTFGYYSVITAIK